MDLLQGNTNVSSLILDDNKLGWKGAGYIALMLCENAVINTLVRARHPSGILGGIGMLHHTNLMLLKYTLFDWWKQCHVMLISIFIFYSLSSYRQSFAL